MLPLDAFHLFPLLPFEIRARIWAFTLLPAFSLSTSASSSLTTATASTTYEQPRLIHVSSPTPPDPVYDLTWRTTRVDAELPPWTANPASYGGNRHQGSYPIALAVCAESRFEAQHYFTRRFCTPEQQCPCYVDLERDYVFLRERKGYLAADVLGWIVEMKSIGLLERVRNLAVPWGVAVGEGGIEADLITVLRTMLPDVKKCAFIYDRYWNDKHVNRVEVVDPGVSWGLVDAPLETATEGEGRFQRKWSSNVNFYRLKMESILEADLIAHKEEWAARGTKLELEFKEGTKQKFEGLWRRYDSSMRASYYEPPGVDFFG